MRFILFLTPFFLAASISQDLHIALRGLQQIRTLIPERLSVQEFAIGIDEDSFKDKLDKMGNHPMNDRTIGSRKSLRSSNYYYTHWVVSGEPVRILDFYQEFEYGPYWRYPTALQKLEDMEYPEKDTP